MLCNIKARLSSFPTRSLVETCKASQTQYRGTSFACSMRMLSELCSSHLRQGIDIECASPVTCTLSVMLQRQDHKRKTVSINRDEEVVHSPGFGHTSFSIPRASSLISNCPFWFSIFPPGLLTPLSSLPSPPPPMLPSFLPSFIQGLHRNASPPTNSIPDPRTFRPLLSMKPSD